MNSMFDSLNRREREMAYSGSPVNLWVRRLCKRLAKAEREDDKEFEENNKQNHDWPWDIPNDIPYYGECE